MRKLGPMKLSHFSRVTSRKWILIPEAWLQGSPQPLGSIPCKESFTRYLRGAWDVMWWHVSSPYQDESLLATQLRIQRCTFGPYSDRSKSCSSWALGSCFSSVGHGQKMQPLRALIYKMGKMMIKLVAVMVAMPRGWCEDYTIGLI